MKGPTAADFRKMNDDDLSRSIQDLEKSLFHLRFQASEDRKNTSSEIRKSRREIARIKTIQRQRAIAAGVVNDKGAK